MRIMFFFLLSFSTFCLYAQSKTPKDYGFQYIQTIYKGDTVDILVKSKKGDEQKTKPLFLFCQGSLPQPLIKHDEQVVYDVFPFNTDSLVEDYHIAIISKPYVPLIAEVKTLGPNYTYVNEKGEFPKGYLERNLLTYYVNRNKHVLRYLQQQPWIQKDRLVVAGHSEGSTIAVKLASVYPGITHLIYSGGSPMGRIMTMIGQSRAIESDTDSTKYGEEEFQYWQDVIVYNSTRNVTDEKSLRTTFEFSEPSIQYLEKLNIPVLVSYGTKDWSAPFNDFLRVDAIRKQKKNFSFNAYIGLEHNYFPLLQSGKINYEIFNWDKVAGDWLKWLRKN